MTRNNLLIITLLIIGVAYMFYNYNNQKNKQNAQTLFSQNNTKVMCSVTSCSILMGI